MRQLVKCTLVLCVFLTCSTKYLLANPYVVDTTKPNLIFIFTDDQRYDETRITGAPEWFVMPAIERIANEGVNFNRTYAPTSMCAPSRASIYTGMYAHQHGVEENGDYLPNDLIYIQQILKDQGYYTGFIGKYFNNTGAPSEFNYYVENDEESVYKNLTYNVNGNPVYKAGHLTNAYNGFLQAFFDSVQVHDQPFALFFFHNAPHPPSSPRPEDLGAYFGQTMPFPENFYPFPGPYPTYYAQTPTIWVKDSMQTVNLIEARLECIKGVDYNVQTIFDFLDGQGITDSTCIIFSSDNGYIYGEHKMRAKVYPMEESIRVPLFVRYPAWFAPGTTVDNDLAELIDIPKTMLELANVPDTFNFQGISLHDLYGPDTLRKYARYEFSGSNEDVTMAPAIRGVRSFDYLYVKGNCDCYEEEFYDLVNDPLEDQNLIFDPQYAGLVDRYRDVLDSLMLAVNDTDPQLQMPCYLVNAIEIPDGIDNDCDGLADDSLGAEWTKYLDLDHDGYGEDAVTLVSFVTPEDYSDIGGDCMDNNVMVNPGMSEICGDGLDNDCDGNLDEVDFTASISPADTAFYCKASFVEIHASPTGPGYTYQWYKNLSMIPGATGPSYSVFSPGSFQVVVTNANGCSTYSTPTLGVKLNNPKPKIKLKSFSNNLLLNSPVKLATSNIPGYSYQWFKNGNIITGATQYKYFATVPGYYTVQTVDLDGCVIVSDEFPVINVLREGAVLSENEMADMQIYPNPASDRIHLHMETVWETLDAPAQIRISDMFGSDIMVLSEEMQSGVVDTEITLPSGIATGVYTIRVEANGYNWVRELVIQ